MGKIFAHSYIINLQTCENRGIFCPSKIPFLLGLLVNWEYGRLT